MMIVYYVIILAVHIQFSCELSMTKDVFLGSSDIAEVLSNYRKEKILDSGLPIN